MHNAKGRSDLEVAADNRYGVIELKYVAEKNAEAPASLAQALSQMKDRRYGLGQAKGREQMRLALAFSEEDRAFVAWRALDE